MGFKKRPPTNEETPDEVIRTAGLLLVETIRKYGVCCCGDDCCFCQIAVPLDTLEEFLEKRRDRRWVFLYVEMIINALRRWSCCPRFGRYEDNYPYDCECSIAGTLEEIENTLKTWEG